MEGNPSNLTVDVLQLKQATCALKQTVWLEPCSFLLRVCLLVRRRINRSAQL